MKHVAAKLAAEAAIRVAEVTFAKSAEEKAAKAAVKAVAEAAIKAANAAEAVKAAAEEAARPKLPPGATMGEAAEFIWELLRRETDKDKTLVLSEFGALDLNQSGSLEHNDFKAYNIYILDFLK